MAATVFGDGTYGCADETGNFDIHCASVTVDLTGEPVWGENHVGAKRALAIKDTDGTMSFSGYLSTAATVGAAIGDALVAAGIANSALFSTDADIDTWYATSKNISASNSGFQEGSLNLIGAAGLSDATGTAVS